MNDLEYINRANKERTEQAYSAPGFEFIKRDCEDYVISGEPTDHETFVKQCAAKHKAYDHVVRFFIDEARGRV